LQSEASAPISEGPPIFLAEGPSLLSLLAAALISFIFLSFALLFVFPLLLELGISGEEGGPLSLPIYSYNFLLEALVGSTVFTVVGVALMMIERLRPFPRWLPLALSFPVAWALVLPSALEHGGSWLGWLVFGAMAAGAFCVHWCALDWARTIWD
jgi:hypothetical protein